MAAAANPAPPRNAKLHFLRVDFQQGLAGNLFTREITFFTRVRTVYGPVDAWEQELDADRPELLPPETLTLTSDELRINEDPQIANRRPRELAPIGGQPLGPVQLRARGNVRIDGHSATQGAFAATADRVSYEQGKELFILEGTDRAPATLWHCEQLGGQQFENAARKIQYNRLSGQIKQDGVQRFEFAPGGAGGTRTSKRARPGAAQAVRKFAPIWTGYGRVASATRLSQSIQAPRSALFSVQLLQTGALAARRLAIVFLRRGMSNHPSLNSVLSFLNGFVDENRHLNGAGVPGLAQIDARIPRPFRVMASYQLPSEQCEIGAACYGCGRRLPLRMSLGDEEAALWECVHCHTPIAGILAPEVLRMLSRRIRLADLHFDVDEVDPLTDAVLQVVWQLRSRPESNKLRDMRRSRRLSGLREVVALRLDNSYCLTGPPIHCVVANLSRHGLFLISTTPLEAPTMITQFHTTRRVIQLIGKVVWARYLDIGCYGAGVDFVARFGRSNTD